MIEKDTVKLLRECDSGVKMGISSIDEVLPLTHSAGLKNLLLDSREEHERLAHDIEKELDRFGDEGKNPNPMIKGMASVKTNMKIAMKPSDNTVADLMTDGCNMGVKSLNRYLNEYAAAEEYSKDIAKKLINMEANLAIGLREYL